MPRSIVSPTSSRKPSRKPLAGPLAALVLFALLVVTGCGTAEPEPAAWDGPEWARELIAAMESSPQPEAPSAASPGADGSGAGTVMWALRPVADDRAELGVYRLAPDEASRAGAAGADPAAEAGEKAASVVEPVPSGQVALVDPIGNRFFLPAALVWPWVPAPATPGQVVTAYRSDAGLVVGRLRSAESGGQPIVAFDWNGVSVERAMPFVHAAAHLPRRVEVLPRPVEIVASSQPAANAHSSAVDTGRLAWEVARADGRVWLLDEAGRVEIRPAAEVGDAASWTEDPAPGDHARLFSWSEGLLPVTIEEVLEPGLRYRVALAADGGATGGQNGMVSSRAVPFDALLPERPAS